MCIVAMLLLQMQIMAHLMVVMMTMMMLTQPIHH
jgi:hypothetical protein